VPHRFARNEVEVRLTPRAVEIFLKGERIAAHLRASSNHRHNTVPEHMPSSHRRYADWTVERIRREAASIGPATAALCELILERRPHPERRKELVGFTDGIRESSQSWRDLLLDLKPRGLTTAPQIAVADGALGFWKALGEVGRQPASNAAGCTRPRTS
jgi:Transposase, Mutator family